MVKRNSVYAVKQKLLLDGKPIRVEIRAAFPKSATKAEVKSLFKKVVENAETQIEGLDE